MMLPGAGDETTLLMTNGTSRHGHIAARPATWFPTGLRAQSLHTLQGRLNHTS